MIVVTGATGAFGSQVVERLLERVAAADVAVSVRDVDRATGLAARGVRVRRGDFAEPDTLAAAFEGAAHVLVVSVDTVGAPGVAQSTAAIDAAYRAGAERVLYSSHQAAHPDSWFAPARDHSAVEAHLEACGRPFTALRNGYYTSSLLFHLQDAVPTGELVAPADGPVSWTTRADLAEGAAAILAGEARFDGPTPPLTASEAVDLQAVAELLSRTAGRAVRRVVADDERWLAGCVARGVPEPFAQVLLDGYRARRRGEFAVTDPTLAALIGHGPESVASVLSHAPSAGPQG